MTIMIIGSLSGCGSASKEVTETTVQTEDTEDDSKAVEQEGAAARAAEEAAVKEVEANEYYEKGRAFLYGLDGNEIDLESAYTNFEKAREMGKQDASFYLGVLCDWYNYPENNYEMAKTYYEESGDNLYSQISLAFLYYNGQGVEEDKERAKEMFQAVIDEGCVEGYLGNASIAYDEEDYETGFEACNKVLEEGKEQLYVVSAMDDTADMYFDGLGVEQDYTKAMEWYQKAASLGDARAMNMIGFMYFNGEGVEQDYSKAMEWNQKAADLRYAKAISNMAYLYRNGLGVEQDYSKAIEWYEKAAALGQTSAMNEIAGLYLNGEGVEQDINKAVEWYEKAEALGDEDAKKYAEAARKLIESNNTIISDEEAKELFLKLLMNLVSTTPEDTLAYFDTNGDLNFDDEELENLSNWTVDKYNSGDKQEITDEEKIIIGTEIHKGTFEVPDTLYIVK